MNTPDSTSSAPTQRKRYPRRKDFEPKNALSGIAEILGYSGAAMARFIGCTQSAWSRAELDNTGLGDPYYERLSELTGFSVRDLKDPALPDRIKKSPRKLAAFIKRFHEKILPSSMCKLTR